jgi:hypothetical protein
MFRTGNLRKRARLSWQQRLAGITMALFLLSHAPTFSFLVEFSDDTVRNQRWSPLQVVAVGISRTQPEWTPYTKYILLPGTFFEQFVLTIDTCYVNPDPFYPCNWTKLTDLDGLLSKADISDKV